MPASRALFTLGVEARLSPATTRVVEGETTTVPPFWFVVVAFAGVDEAGAFSMRSALTGVEVDGSVDFLTVGRAVNKALRHYPVDGRDILVVGNRVVSRIDPNNVANRTKGWRLWIPATETLALPGQPDPVVDGRVTGWGVAIEMRNNAGYLAPYLAVQVQEEQPNGQVAPLVVPARTVEPFEEASRIESGARLAEAVPALFQTLRSMADIGARARIRCAAKSIAHYALEEVYPDTIMGGAFAAAARQAGAGG